MIHSIFFYFSIDLIILCEKTGVTGESIIIITSLHKNILLLSTLKNGERNEEDAISDEE